MTSRDGARTAQTLSLPDASRRSCRPWPPGCPLRPNAQGAAAYNLGASSVSPKTSNPKLVWSYPTQNGRDPVPLDERRCGPSSMPLDVTHLTSRSCDAMYDCGGTECQR